MRTCDILEFYSLTARPFKYTVDLEEIHKLGFSLFASTWETPQSGLARFFFAISLLIKNIGFTAGNIESISFCR